MKNIHSTLIGISLLSAVAVDTAIAEEITARKLYEEFVKNEIAAEAKYKGNRITVTGKVFDISKNIAGQPVVNLEAGTLSFVSCRFPKDAVSQLAKIQKDDNIKLSCKVNYKMLTTIFLFECTFNLD